MKKKLIALLLCLALFATLVACAGQHDHDRRNDSGQYHR